MAVTSQNFKILWRAIGWIGRRLQVGQKTELNFTFDQRAHGRLLCQRRRLARAQCRTEHRLWVFLNYQTLHRANLQPAKLTRIISVITLRGGRVHQLHHRSHFVVEPNPTTVATTNGRCKRSARKRSRSWSLRDGANTRWHACSSITWKALRRTRIYLWVDQRSKATPDQTWEEDPMQDGKYRCSCCPWSSSSASVLVKYIFKSSNRAKWLSGPRKLARFTKTQNKNKKRDDHRASEDRLRHFPEWLEDFADDQKDTEVPAPHTFLMSQIGNVPQKWHPGSAVFLPTSRKIEIAIMLANQDDKGSLQKTHLRSSTSSRKVWWHDNSRSKSSMRRVNLETITDTQPWYKI